MSLGVRRAEEPRGRQTDSFTRLETRWTCASVTRSSSQQQRRCVHSGAPPSGEGRGGAGDSVGELAEEGGKAGEGREDTECESQCDWFQIEKQGEGLLLCPAASPGCWRGAPQVRSRTGQWGLCRRNGCDYRPGGGFLPPSGSCCCCCGQSLCANEGALIMIMSPPFSQMPPHLYLQHLLNYKNLNSDLPPGPVYPPTSCKTIVGYSQWFQYLAVFLTQYELPASFLSGAFYFVHFNTLKCLKGFITTCTTSALQAFCGRWIFSLLICLLLKWCQLLTCQLLSRRRMKLLCVLNIYIPVVGSSLSSQTFPKENYFRNI